MSSTLFLEEVSPRFLAAQIILSPGLQQPITHSRALLLLSRPACSVVMGYEEATVLEFFGLYWVLEAGGARPGIFYREDDAVRYLQRQMSIGQKGGQEE